MTARTLPVGATRGDHATGRRAWLCLSMCADLMSLQCRAADAG